MEYGLHPLLLTPYSILPKGGNDEQKTRFVSLYGQLRAESDG